MAERDERYRRTRETSLAAALLVDIVGRAASDHPDLLTPLDDDAFWARKDAEVAANQARAAAAQARKELEIRASVMASQGAPRRALEVALAPDCDLTTEAVAAVRDWQGGDVIALIGGVGRGKTVAAVWWMARYGGPSPMFVRAAELEATGRYGKEARELRKRWQSASALIIDDLGVEFVDAKGNFLVILDGIIDYFYAQKRALILTTNLTGDDFKLRYGERITSRLRQGKGWRAVGGADLRRSQLKAVAK